ncbi:MAG TPA: 5-methylcytosine-specific restriction endonuclease system specificity protein McrC [Niabella sp.]|nr:5-methylcytosine-specific restriction endonuclease system specificity protein McrC [Niabella sp.]HQX72541.1 5-methylcytosine-specific restriction endonuclease system specificity protein McrC [Chitinophagaceae bacterium]HQW16270.1 5-methylcytosine-specific restriction endonuclease system specificity protein McrC [Niabella sp.]HQX21498.1 5-methylcytosine-specific restriction endonuclease system specificity protein McrC [Niabella sp.]HRB36088.1 5-methylcytosine-specific restriction endonuclease
MQIPIENIYYLLCYAWNKLDEKERVNASIDDKIELLDLFAKVLINATKTLLKRGIDKSYIDYTEEIPGIKGKIQISQTLKRNLLFKQKTICTFDNFSANIIANRILLSTIYRLTRTVGLDRSLKNELVGLQRMLSGIELIEISNSLFKQVRLNRNNWFYGFVMNVCQIIYESIFPSEEPGKYKFSDFTKDDKKMNQLFEAFIRNFYKREQAKYKTVKKEIIEWQFDCTENTSHQYLPQMETDITLENEEEKIIIDAKFYREAMAVNYDKEKIRSANLYQLFSYLLNQHSDNIKTRNATGILLYPTVDKEYDLNFFYQGHKIQIRTINLNTNWRDISSRLKSIIESD